MSRTPKYLSKIPGTAHLFKRGTPQSDSAVDVAAAPPVASAPAVPPIAVAPVAPAAPVVVPEPKIEEIMPDYASMGYPELKSLVTQEDEDRMPNSKKATIVAFLVEKWKAAHAA